MPSENPFFDSIMVDCLRSTKFLNEIYCVIHSTTRFTDLSADDKLIKISNMIDEWRGAWRVHSFSGQSYLDK